MLCCRAFVDKWKEVEGLLGIKSKCLRVQSETLEFIFIKLGIEVSSTFGSILQAFLLQGVILSFFV